MAVFQMVGVYRITRGSARSGRYRDRGPQWSNLIHIQNKVNNSALLYSVLLTY